MKKIGVVMGSKSDLPTVDKAVRLLQEYGAPLEVHVFSAHRCPDEARAFAASARENGFGVLIAAAGMAAHLAGALAANTTLPVIGIPLRAAGSDGTDALARKTRRFSPWRSWRWRTRRLLPSWRRPEPPTRP